jgi:hypothetical protein
MKIFFNSELQSEQSYCKYHCLYLILQCPGMISFLLEAQGAAGGGRRGLMQEKGHLEPRLKEGGITVTGLYQINAVTAIMKIIPPILFILLIRSDFSVVS